MALDYAARAAPAHNLPPLQRTPHLLILPLILGLILPEGLIPESMSNSDSHLPTGFGWSQGIHTKQPHVDVPPGTYEEEHARRGFFGRTSHLYHRHPPTGWLEIEGPLKPRAYRAVELTVDQVASQRAQPKVFLANAECELGIAKLSSPMTDFVRNADGDEVRFIHQGKGTLETDYGNMAYEKGDYLVIPRGTTYRFLPTGADTHLVIEARSEIEIPDRGMLGRHALFDPSIMRTPTLSPEPKKSTTSILWIKRMGEWTKVTYPFSPIDIAGWKGDLVPWGLNVRDIRPVISARYHLPPSVHTTFKARGFVICSFLPRPFESEEGAMRVPFYHRNIDFDEVLFYHEGNFFSREGIKEGAVTFHPQGIHHGPHPNAATNVKNLTHTEEIAVMVDTVNPLIPTADAQTVEWKEYYLSWKADQKR